MIFLLIWRTSNAQDQPPTRFHFSLVQSFSGRSDMPVLHPFGLEAGYSFMNSEKSPWGVGLSLGYQNYGLSKREPLRTSHSIYNISTHLYINLYKSKRFRLYLEASAGINRLVTRSFTGNNELEHAMGVLLMILLNDEEDCSCDGNEIVLEPLVVLKKHTSISPSLGVGLGAEWLVSEQFGFSVETGYRYLEETRLVEKDQVDILGDAIHYTPTRSHLGLLNIKIGLVHYF